MPSLTEVPPEALVDDLAMTLWQRCLPLLRDLARRKKWEPKIENCRLIAIRQVEQLKAHGVLHVTRRTARDGGARSSATADEGTPAAASTPPKAP
jgi:hypothetical protein